MKKLISFIAVLAFIQARSQNVGINNLSPQLPLDILKTGGGNMIRLLNPSSATGATSGILFTNSASYSTPGFNSASIVAVRKPAGGQDLIFSTSQTSGAALERLRIDTVGNLFLTGGKIAVGTLTPVYDLHLSTNSPSIGFFDEDDNHYAGTIVADSIDLSINAYRKSSVGTNTAGDLLLQVNSGGFPNFLAGNVGIGVSSPTAKLHIGSSVMIGSGSPAVGYLLSVNGKIISEEVRVELDATWPDYVFENSYSLPSLLHLERFIRTNKHLPNIPSANQVKQEGFDLGDMNRRLLEKIEELTLYIIKQDKKLIQQDNKLNALQHKVQKIQARL